jgi:glycerophosphoryl diester phosphodiesterase
MPTHPCIHLLILLLLITPAGRPAAADDRAQITRDALGERPFTLAGNLEPGELRDRLLACRNGPFRRTRFGIGHRGAPLGYPEHTRESYLAAARQGAGIVECDVTFTRDRALVCRHSQCDLHTTTDILRTDLAGRCSTPFTPADPEAGTPASARCCTSDLTLAEFRTLCGRRDTSNPAAGTVGEYLGPEDGEAACGTLMTHAESIALLDELGVGMTPELKRPEVEMPFQGDYRQQDFARQMIDDYRRAGIGPARVWVQSFDLRDLVYWIAEHPDFARQAVYLDARVDAAGFDLAAPDALTPSMEALRALGVRIIAPPMWALLTLDDDRIVPSAYARTARAAGLDIVTWTLERSGSLATGGGYYYQSVADAVDDDSDVYTVLDVLARDVGIIAIFSDWPATVTYYASCMDL